MEDLGPFMSPQDRTDPTALQEAVGGTPAPAAAVDKRRSKMPSTILIADDEPAFRDYLGTLLRTQGFRVVAAADGVDALDVFAHHQPDLVLLDIEMPHVDGLEVCRRLKQNPETRLTP